MNVLQELRQKHAALCDQQQAIVTAAVNEGRAWTETEQAQFDALQPQINAMAATIKAAEDVQSRAAVLDQPVGAILRPSDHSTQTPQLDNGGFSCFGEFLAAVRFGDPRGRIRNDMSMGNGQNGGFAVPDQFKPELLRVTPEAALVRPRARVIEAGNPPDAAITMPAFSQGANGAMGGVVVTWIAEGSAKPETEGQLEEVTLEPKEVAGHTVVTDKLLRNWQAASGFISELLRGAIWNAEDMAFISGNGVGRPLGVLNAPGRIDVARQAAATIGYLDTVNLEARLNPESRGRAVYVASISALPALRTMQDPNNNYIFVQGDITKGQAPSLNGFPLFFSGKNPTIGNRGDLMLVDFSYFLIKDGSGPFVAASEHVQFLNNKTVIKVFWNVDGQGWVKSPLLLENGATTVSPYVFLQ
jgi:HK97 family phage major capsid protein